MGWAVIRARGRRIEGFLTKADPVTPDMTGTARHIRRLLTLMPPGGSSAGPGRGGAVASRPRLAPAGEPVKGRQGGTRNGPVPARAVRCRARLEQQRRGFGIGLRSVLDAAGDDEELPRRKTTLRSPI